MSLVRNATEPEEPAEQLAKHRDYVAYVWGAGWFIAVVAIGLGLWSVGFQVDQKLQTALGYGFVIGLVLLILRGTPSSSLTPDRVALRDGRRTAGVVGGSAAFLLLTVVVAVGQLDSWDQVIVLASLFVGVIGVGFMLHEHLLFRKRRG